MNGILAQYVQHCKARAAADEGTVWRAVDCFGVNWDIEDSDFPAMFADAMQQAQPTLDNPALQPIGGLQNLMLRDSEVELVRECFRWLYNEDGGDISKRRGRAELFADQINGRFRRVFPRMTKYTMNTANAVFFLNLWEPHANYFYQASEAKAWADYFGYEADFGGGTALDLPRYYTMCNDLLHALENYPEIIALHKAYAEQELGGIDDALHLLVYDILHTAYAEQFYPKGYTRGSTSRERAKAVKEKADRAELCIRIGECEQELGGIDDALHLLVYDILHTAYAEQFYPKGYTRGSTSRERAKAVKEKADRAELCIRIGECEQELQELLANPAALPDLTGCKINHKMFGAGTVRPAEGQFMVIDFNGTLKKFSYTASMNSGYLSAEDPNVEARLQAYQDYNKDKDRLEKELKNLKAELVKL